MKLNLGCWIHPLMGYLNVDIEHWEGVDQLVDLNILPWPWKDGQFEEVRAIDIVEHIGRLTKTDIVRELARTTQRDGLVIIRVPCEKHSWAWASLQHAHSFQYNSFEESYAQPWFKVERIEVQTRDNRRAFRLNRFFRVLCKIGMIQTLTFYLRKK